MGEPNRKAVDLRISAIIDRNPSKLLGGGPKSVEVALSKYGAPVCRRKRTKGHLPLKAVIGPPARRARYRCKLRSVDQRLKVSHRSQNSRGCTPRAKTRNILSCRR